MSVNKCMTESCINTTPPFQAYCSACNSIPLRDIQQEIVNLEPKRVCKSPACNRVLYLVGEVDYCSLCQYVLDKLKPEPARLCKTPGCEVRFFATPDSEYCGNCANKKSVADRDPIKTRYDLICPSALERLAKTLDEGVKHYGEHNWCKGLPKGETLSHAIAHIYAYLNGDISEDHLGHAMCNLMFVIHYERQCEHHKELQTLQKTDGIYIENQ